MMGHRTEPESPFHLEELEVRMMLSAVEIIAAGSTNAEIIELKIAGQNVASFSDLGTGAYRGEFRSLKFETDSPVSADDVRIEFVNDLYEPENGIDRNVRIDAIVIDGVRFESESSSVFSTGTWKEADGIQQGFRQDEFLHANGYLQYANNESTEGTIVRVRARGMMGGEQFRLLIGGNAVATFEATTDFQTFSFTAPAEVDPADVRIEFFGDVFAPEQGIDKNLVVDFMSLNEPVYQTESETTFSTGTWKEADGIQPGFRQSEVLHADGFFQYSAGPSEPVLPGRFAFSALNYSVDERSPSIQVRVDRLGGTDGVASVEYATVDVTTTQLEDYVPVVGKLTFGDGQASMLITIPIIQDPFAESDETFLLRLSNATGGATIETDQAEITIVDDDTVDPAGFFRFSRPMYMVMEGLPSLAVTIIRDAGSSGQVSVDYFTGDDGASAGEDYTAVSGTLTFADGETEKTILIPIIDDTLAEDDERFWIYLENPTGGAAVVVSGAQLIITDNEPRTGRGDGLYAEYFNNVDFTDLARVGVDETIAFNFGTGAPAGVAADTFSVRWTGQIEPLYSEEYTFQTTSDDGVRLWIDGRLIIDRWTNSSATVDTGTIRLEAGRRYDIRMEYFENAGVAVAQLRWSSGSQSLEIVPQSQLYSGGKFQRGESTYGLTPTAMSWNEAQAYAQRLGGNLVTITDASEEAFLQSSFGTELTLWTGLNDIANEGTFVWASGESVNYLNFAPGEPNNLGGNQDSVTFNFGANKQWDDDDSSKQFFGVIEVTGSNLPSQNSIFGSWGGVIEMPNIAVAAAQLPDGNIVTWSSWDRYRFGGNNPRTFTTVFNTETQQLEEFLITQTQHDMFCPGTVMLSDGRIMVNGGGSTVTSTSIYDFKTDTWTRVENMQMRRWYNTSVTLADGRVLTWGGNALDGHAGDAEVWEEGVGWSRVDGMNINIYAGTGDQSSWHPQIFQAPNGKVFVAGPGPQMYWADLNDLGSVLEAAGTRPDGYSQHGIYIMYDVGKILKFGGADREANNGTVTNKAYIIDINGDIPVVTETGEMNFSRKFANSVVLPDGRVMAIGGNTSGMKFSDDGSVFAAEVWDPQTGEWSVMDSMTIPRNYHSVALLQADGTVFAAGGGLTGGTSADHPDAQVFRPDYLFNNDGSLADRPEITTVAAASYADRINVNVTDGQAITRFNLIRMSTVTHSVNTDQRFIPSIFTDEGSGRYVVDLPDSSSIAPPGFYMLYALNADGTPSESAVVQLG